MNSLTTEQRFWGKVHKTGDCWLWTAGKNSAGYGTFWYAGKMQLVHRLSWSWANMCPIPPSRLEIDHICHELTCINPEHLRLVTQKQNLENKSGLYANNKSGYQGVSWHKRVGKWRAATKSNGRTIHVGYFLDVHEAGAAALEMRNKLFTHNDKDRN